MAPPTPRTLVENGHYRLVDESDFFRLTRTSLPFTSALDAETGSAPVHLALDAAGRSRLSLLIDSRDAPSRNDPEYEAWFKPQRLRTTRGVKRVAILVRSAVGKLHAERLLREESGGSGELLLFTDEAEALAFLRKPR